ncbi:MAG TPA: acyl-CoA dehydrogenase [Kofleriaceae bacterium]|nr:acyl-CoA dehydrogenase [Kofleriaceae bacterium]
MRPNPLVDDRVVEFLLYQVFDVERLCELPYFADHGRDSFDLILTSARRLAREVLYPSYRSIDEAPPRLVDGRIEVHPSLRASMPQLLALGLIAAPRPAAVGGDQVPLAISALASAYLMAGNLSAYGYVGLTAGAAHLIEAFADEALQKTYLARMYRGQWLGTMALTEPQAGSSLSDVQTTASPAAGGHYLIRGSKIFISAGDHDLTENIVHMTLARIRGAPAGIKGVSLFLVPKRRLEGGVLVSNDIAVAGAIHKIGWRGLPSLALEYGDHGDCHGWLVGEPHQGITYMFQMMNEARIMVGMNAAATASVAYQESLTYARNRPQGRPLQARDPGAPQVPITAHADVRRMLLRQKAIVEGSLALLLRTSLYSDLSRHATDPAERDRAALLLDLLTPIAKSFPAERGFESNALALQIHGGYGYSSEYLPEAWLRDQKLNTIHEGTTGIQSLDLLGRRAVARGGAALAALAAEVRTTCARATEAGCEPAWIAAVERSIEVITSITAELGQRGLSGDVEGMMRHSFDYLDLFATAVVAWQWLELAAAASEARRRGEADEDGFHRAQTCAAQYWLRTELPRIDHLAELCRSGEDSYARLDPDWL